VSPRPLPESPTSEPSQLPPEVSCAIRGPATKPTGPAIANPMVAPIKLLKKPKASPLVCFDPDPRVVESSHTLAFRGLSRAYPVVAKYSTSHTSLPLHYELKVPLLCRFSFVKSALACSRIAAVVTHVDFAMIVAGLRPKAASGLVLIGAHQTTSICANLQCNCSGASSK